MEADTHGPANLREYVRVLLSCEKKKKNKIKIKAVTSEAANHPYAEGP